MATPRAPRTILSQPVAPLFKPGGMRAPAQVRLGADEFEALRLADLEGPQQVDAAPRMGISRQTFGRVLSSARRKVASALVNGLALRVDGARGASEERRSRCGADALECDRCSQPLVQLRRRGRARRA
jgi:predicted DNA-binding protein (UPF0251 family)